MYAKESSGSYDVKEEYNITEHRAVRLLSRRYDLTNTGYKFLEIGINVGPPSYVEIIADTNYRRLSKRGRSSTSSEKILQAVSKRIQR
ncbi:hypothetical protein G5I_10433 [Acromyrmex echinatior]|uniref:Uncharacterized protein n=1 Tax=Acromyrmex echinatior TaxID=103372 RepID=F4WWW0_ACREC|nr:hypothetical protein G5I_10433 [Acromyrmex echinatior]